MAEQPGEMPKVLTLERLKEISSFESEVHADSDCEPQASVELSSTERGEANKGTYPAAWLAGKRASGASSFGGACSAVHTLDPLLAAINQRLGLNLAKRPDGFHATIVGPAEFGVAKTLSSQKIVELEKLNEEIQRGEGVVVRGIGFIDGATLNVREADKAKRAAFVAIDAPKLQAFRASIGLRPKDFHITLGFKTADLHMQVVGMNEKGKPVLGPVAKKADSRFDDLLPLVESSGMRFGSLSGVAKEKSKKKTG